MSTKRKEIDTGVFAGAAIPQPDPVSTAMGKRHAMTATPGRRDKVQIQGYFPEETRRRLKAVAAREGRTVEDLLGEAITVIFDKYERRAS